MYSMRYSYRHLIAPYMKVEELKISNYKSFREEQQIVCGRRNVFIGKNGSGKSNLLSGIENLFLGRKSGELQYNGKDSAAVVTAVISNPQKEYGLPERFVLEMICKDRIEYLIDKKSVSHSLVSTFSEVAGIREWAFVRQGEITEIGGMSKKDKYNYVLSVIGVNKYEKRKEEALKLLESNDIAKIEEMLEKIEEKVSFFESQRSKVAEYDILKEKKGGIEYDLMKWELLELNDEINKLFISHKVSEPKNEALLDFELEEVRNGICKLSQELAVIDNKLKNSCEVGKEEKKLFELQKQKEEELEKLMLLKAGIETEAQALRFFESIGTKSENIEVLERRVKEIERQLGMPLDGARNVGIESGIRERKEYWVKERQLKEDIEGLKEKEKRLREKLYCTGNESVSVYETVKDEEGVIGIVYELIDVPDEASEAFEAVAKSKAFWIVVENVEVGLQLVDKTDGVAGFLALDRIPEVKKTLIEDPRLVKLTSIIKCEKRIRKVLDFICKDFYVSTDLKGGVSLAEQYNANVVTTEGEIVTRSGLITGGYERGEQTLRDLQKYRKEMQRKEKELKEVQKYLEVLSVTSEGAEEQSYLPAMALACKWKISLIRDKKIKLRDKASIEAELAKYRGRVGILKAEIKAIERRLPAEKANEIEVTEKLAKRKKEIEASIEELKKKEYLLVDTIYGTDEMIKENNDFSTQKKHILIDKRSQLLSKMGKTDYHQSVPERTKEELKTEFRKVSNDLKRYAGCERAVKKADEGRKLREKIRSINQEKNYIRGFIEKADKRRDVIVAEALSVISREYACIYEEIWGSKSDLLVRGDAIDVRIGGEVVEPASLSGGQKTAVAFSMIMALQKYSPSPFYIFDELDANLDQRARKAVYYYIGKSNGQYFLTSFKEESLLCGDRFYGVVCSDKCSKVCQIEPDLALDMVRTSSSENNRIDSI